MVIYYNNLYLWWAWQGCLCFIVKKKLHSKAKLFSYLLEEIDNKTQFHKELLLKIWQNICHLLYIIGHKNTL